MKKLGRMLLLCLVVIECCSCGGIEEHDDNLIVTELQGLGSETLQDKTVTEATVLRKQMLEESKQQTIDCAVVYKDEKKEYRRNVTLSYSYYDEGGWNLESADFDEVVEVYPIEGPDTSEIERALREAEGDGTDYADDASYDIKNSSVDLQGKKAEYEIELNTVHEKYKVVCTYSLSFIFHAQNTARILAGWTGHAVKKTEESVSLISVDNWSEEDWFEWSYWRSYPHSLEVEDCGDYYNFSLVIEDENEEGVFFDGEVEIDKEGHTRDEDGNIVLEFPNCSSQTDFPTMKITVQANDTVVIALCRSDGSWY